MSHSIAQTLLNLAKQPDAMTHPDGMQIKITRQEITKLSVVPVKLLVRILKNAGRSKLDLCTR